MKNTLLILVVSLLCLTAYSQENYREGYIITLENDTLRGWVDFRSDKQNSTICSFKPDLDSKKQEFYPKDISGYRYMNDGKFYVSREIEINGVNKTVFLEYLLEGIENLYYYAEEDIKYYILENMKGELLYTSQEPDRKIFTNDGDKYMKDLKYIGVLKYYFKDHPEIQKKIDQTEYTHGSMIELVKAYHNLVCPSDQECVIFESKDIYDKYKIKFSPYIGYNYLASYKSDGNDYFFKNKLDKSYPVIGIQASCYLSRISQSFSLDLDLSFSTIKWKEMEDNETYKVRCLTGIIKAGPGYTYYKGRVRPSIQAGFTMLRIFDPTIENVNDKSGTESFYYLEDINNMGLGFYISAGINIKTAKDSFVLIKATYDKYFTDIKNSDLSFIGARIGYTF